MLKSKMRKRYLLFGIFLLGMMINIPAIQIQAATIGAISVCQAGYSTNQLKTAVVVTSGALTDTSYQIVRAGDGTQVASGTMTGYTPSGWTRGETYYKIDFTSLSQTGDFKITSNGASSNSFTIADNIWTNYLDEMVEFYRLQRCGYDTAAALPGAGFTNRPSVEALHAACHMDDAKKGSESGTNANMTGGWHDAGDNNKYGGNSWVAGAIAITFLRRSNAIFDYDANGVPDLLDEARVGAENILNIQDAAGVNGGVYDSIDAPNGQHYAWKYPAAETDGVRGNADDRMGHSRNVSALTYDGTMKSAGSLAAVARAFATRDSAFANRCKTGAINAYNWALSNSGNTGGWYAISDQNNPRFWAAVELYRLTNEATYGNWISTYLNSLTAIAKVNGTNYWGLQPISLAEYYPVATATEQTKITSLLSTDANGWRTGLVAPFGVTSKISTATFGINEPNISFAADAYRLYEITGDNNLRDAAVAAAQWTFGVNPWNISWVCGVGAKYPTHMHSRLDADADSNAASTIKLPGFMVAGANWSDTLNSGSTHPWYEDRALANDSNNWKYNEFSISIQYGLLDLMVALAYGSGNPGTPTPTPTVTVTSTPTRTGPVTVTPTPTSGVTVTVTPTSRPSSTATPTRRVTPTPTRRVRVTPTRRVIITATPTPTVLVTPTATSTPTTPSATPTPTSVSGAYVVSYVIQSDWGNGATISVTIKNNTVTAVNGWTLAFTFPGNQTITNLWNGTYTQSGAAVTVKDAGFNANISGNGGSVNFGFNLNYSGTNAKPTSFTLNGQACQIQ